MTACSLSVGDVGTGFRGMDCPGGGVDCVGVVLVLALRPTGLRETTRAAGDCALGEWTLTSVPAQ
jgi:hypothetical protein